METTTVQTEIVDDGQQRDRRGRVNCLRHGVEPLAYLRDVLARLPSMTNQDDFDSLMPSRWQPRS